MKIFWLPICIILLLLFISRSAPGYAIEGEVLSFTGNFDVRQEKFRSGSILVCRPDFLDIKITSIIAENKISSVVEYAEWLKSNIKYKPDKVQDKLTQPGETIDRGFGDCEDFAFLTAAFLRVIGYDPKIMVVADIRGYGHVICVFKLNRTFYWFDNQKLKETPASTIKEFTNYLHKNYRCAHIFEIRSIV
ncbi:MAG: transglutaminase-like domain-containing protein [Candidatus Omnitrophota bacterium]